MKKHGLARLSFVLICLPGIIWATPPGTPITELRGSDLSLGLFYDQSGQKLFLEGNPSVLNTAGAGLSYGVIQYLEVGIFGGMAEFNVGVPPGKKIGDPDGNGSTLKNFESGYDLFGGASAKLATPRFLSGKARFVGYGTASIIKAEDKPGNRKSGKFYNSGILGLLDLPHRFTVILGGEFYAIDEGSQESAAGTGSKTFGMSEPNGTMDHIRAVVGVEYFFKGRNRSFISLAFRPTGELGYEDNLGLQGGSISLTLGAISNFGNKVGQSSEDDGPTLDE